MERGIFPCSLHLSINFTVLFHGSRYYKRKVKTKMRLKCAIISFVIDLMHFRFSMSDRQCVSMCVQEMMGLVKRAL